MLIKEYNLNIIDLNLLFDSKIEYEIYSFIIKNDLSLKLNNKDTKRIFLHFLLFFIFSENNFSSENIFIFNNLQKLNYLNSIFQENNTIDFFNNLIKLIYNNFSIKILINKNINLTNIKSNNFNEIYKLKNLLQNEKLKCKNFQKSKIFCKKFGLENLSDSLENNKLISYNLNSFR